MTAELAPRNELLLHYDRLLADGIARARPVSLILANLDRFKAVNLEIGPLAADQVLEQASAILAQDIATEHRIARIGGDLFAILQQSDLAAAKRHAEFLRQEIAQTTFANGIRLTASFGVAATTEAKSFEDLLREAEACLYAAKANGRNCVEDSEEFAAQAADDKELFDNDNKIRVLTDRLSDALRLRSRSVAGRLKAEADRDGLTGLFNRRYFDRRLNREFESARALSKHLSIVFLDLDLFGNVNRTYGHPAGDEALRTFARALRDSIRSTDWAARYGGEEFCVVLPETSAGDAYLIAERIRAALRQASVACHDGRTFRMTVSQGVAELVSNDTCPTDLVQRASDRLRKAKNDGRDRISA